MAERSPRSMARFLVYTELCERVCTHGKQLDVGGVRTLRVHPEPPGCTVPVRCFPAAARSDHLGKPF